ncbi:hypothetical protein AHAS_Ahas13G0282400 [Arachis hypogaea]
MGWMPIKRHSLSTRHSSLTRTSSIESSPNPKASGSMGNTGLEPRASPPKTLLWRLECGHKSCSTTYFRALMSPLLLPTWPFLSGASSQRNLSTCYDSSNKLWVKCK